MKRVLSRWLDALFGELCVCGQRVYPKDVAKHERLEHAGDQVPIFPEHVTGPILNELQRPSILEAVLHPPVCRCGCHLSRPNRVCRHCWDHHSNGAVR